MSEIYARRGLVDRALSNLLDNALKFSPAGSEVDIVVDGTRIDVLDRGPGIATDDRKRIFDRFYRTDTARNRPGSGLGLAIVKEIITLHKGTINLVERPGGGTVAILEFPARDEDDTDFVEHRD